MLPQNNLGPDESWVSVNETLFRGMIGSLMYLIASRPDIQFSVCLCARYQANSKESHLVVVKRIFRYLKGTPNLGLWYPKGLGFDLKAYSDSDYAGCNLDRKSTLGGSEAEYVDAAGCCAQDLWIKSQLADYDVLYDKVPIFCDNTRAIAISNNPVLHSRTKHIDISFTRLVAELGMLNIKSEMIAYALCWGLDIDIAGILYDDLISKLKAGRNKGREKNICYIRYMSLVIEHLLAYVNKDLNPTKSYQITVATFKQSSFSEVPLTSYMHKIAKLSEEPLILTSEEENAKGTGDKSLSETVVHPVSKPKPKTNKKRRTKKISSSYEPNVSKYTLDFSLFGDVPLESLNTAADESPYDTESEIKIIKRFKPIIEDEKPLFTSEFKEQSDTLGHLQAVITSLSNKVDQLESSITNRVSKIQSSVPNLITETLKEQLLGLLSDALKTTLTTIVKDVIKESVEEKQPVFDEHVQQTLKSQIPALFIKPMNKELNAFNKLEAKTFIHLQKELRKVIQTQIGKKVKAKVRTGMSKVTERLESLMTSTHNNSDNVSDLKQQIADMVSLLKSAEVLKQTNADGKKCEKENPC
ncbi:hypothetical protein Tco_1089854 [Tanacetum coccineum]